MPRLANDQRCSARKNYFYPEPPQGLPDQPDDLADLSARAFSTSPWTDGSIKRVGVTRAHLEEDAGKESARRPPGHERYRPDRAGKRRCWKIVSEPTCVAPRKPWPDAKTCTRWCVIWASATATWRMAPCVAMQTCPFPPQGPGRCLHPLRDQERQLVSAYREAINTKCKRQIELESKDGGKVVQKPACMILSKDETRFHAQQGRG